MNIHALRQAKAEALKTANDIHNAAVKDNGRAFSAEEQTNYDAAMADVRRYEASIKRTEEQAGFEPATPAAAAMAAAPDAENPGVPAAPVASKRGISLFGMGSKKGFGSFGEMLQAVRADATGHGRDPRLTAGPTGINESTPSEGGFAVQQDMSQEILQQVYATGVLASRVKRYPVGANSNGVKMNAVDERSRANGSRNGGITSFWKNEADALQASKPKFREMEMTLNKLTGLVYVTDEILQDVPFMTSFISDVVPNEIGFRMDDAILNGLGNGQPLGILQSRSLIVVPKDNNQTAGTVTASNIVNMWSRLQASSRKNAVWVVEQSVEAAFFSLSLQGSAGGVFPVFLPPGGISGAPYATLYGAPVLVVEQAASLGLQGDINLLDLSQYQLIDKGDVQKASSIHVRFLEDETVFRFTYRVDGKPLWDFPVQPFSKNAPTRSPFVTLAARQ